MPKYSDCLFSVAETLADKLGISIVVWEYIIRSNVPPTTTHEQIFSEMIITNMAMKVLPLSQKDQLIFGIEMELTLRPKTGKIEIAHPSISEVHSETTSWVSVAEILAHNLRRKNIPVSWSASPVNLDYRRWNIVPEETIDSTPGYYDMEIVSPALGTDTNWQSQLTTIWEVLDRYFEIRQSPSCSTHIHISLASKWALPSLRALCKCIVYYDPVIDAIVPASRRGNFWCQSNIYAPKVEGDLRKLQRTGFRPAFLNIDKIQCDSDVAGYISPSKTYSWNFNNVGGRRKLGTVEFRRPAMSTCAQDAIRWAVFTFAFIRAAETVSDNGFTLMMSARSRPGLNDLHSFIQAGAGLMGLDVDCLFKGRSYQDEMTVKAARPELDSGNMKFRRHAKRSLACTVLMMAHEARKPT